MSHPLFPNPFNDDRMAAAEGFNPALDVPSLHEHATQVLLDSISRVSKRKDPDGEAKILVLRSIPGVGKTHVVGRVSHQLGDKALFVSVPQLEKHARPVKHILWHVLRRLFDAPPEETPLLHHVLARLCQHSFRRFFDQLPHTVKDRHRSLRERLDDNPATVLEIAKEAKEAGPYLKLAESIAGKMPALPAEIVRALVLGWSPRKNDAWRWLRGEQVEESRLVEMMLPQDAPTSGAVLYVLASILHRLQMPVVIFFDQSEQLLNEPGALKELTTTYMGWLDTIPNLVLGLTFLKEDWDRLRGAGFQSFEDRSLELDLGQLNGAQAVELIANRLRGWPGGRVDKGPLWPFVEDSLLNLMAKQPFFPRSLLKTCRAALDPWLAKKSETELRFEGEKPPPPPVEDLFRQEWDRYLERIRKKKMSPSHVQEERLFRAVQESLQVLKSGSVTVGGLDLIQMQDRAMSGYKSLQLKLGLKDSNQAITVVIAVTKTLGGMPMTSYIEALKLAIASPVAGAVLVLPSPTTLGPKTVGRKKYEELRNAGRLRPFELGEHRTAFEQMECYLQLLDAAANKDLQLGQALITQEDCRKLAAKTQVLSGLGFFDIVFCGWPQSASIVAAGAEAPAVAHATSTVAKAVPAPAAARATSPPPTSISSRQGTDGPPVPVSPPSTQFTADASWSQNLLAAVANKLIEFGQKVEAMDVQAGPTFVRLRLKPLGKTFIGRIRNHANDLRTHIAAIATVPVITDQAGYISVDVQRPDRQTVALLDYLSQAPAKAELQPVFPVGVDVASKPYWLNLADPSTCHVLAAGTTGSGKSEFLKAMLAGLAARLTPLDLKFILIDPKRVTFNFPKGSPYLLHPVAHTAEEAMPLVQACFAETEKRYSLLQKRGLEHIGQLQGKDALPRIVVVFDEFADLMADKENRKELEGSLKRIGAMARAAGIHLVLATQRPDKDVVTPQLKNNLPTRICLRVNGERNSKIILDEEGGENLLGHGDLFWKHGSGMVRLQGMFVPKPDLERLLKVDH